MSDFRKIVAQDPTIGAGDFFYRFSDHCADPSALILESDASIVLGGREYGSKLSVAVVRDMVDQLVACLLERGVRARQPIGVFVGDSPAYYLHYIALSRIGAIAVLLNSNMPGSTAAEYLRRVGCAAVILDQARAARLSPHAASLLDAGGTGPELILTESLQLSGPSHGHQPFLHRADDVVLIAHTSGTTGAPKPVQFNHAGYFFGVRQQMAHVLGPKVLSALPHSHGSAITMFMSTVIRGIPLFAQTKKDPESLLGSIESWRPQLVMAFPKPLVDLCRVDLDERDLSSVSCWMSTGDASHEPHIRRLVSVGSRVQGGRRMPGSLYVDNLGSSEFAFGIFRNVHSPETDCYDRCIGRPFEWVDVRIFGEDGLPARTNEVGRLGVKSPSVTSGYWKDSATTQLNRLHGYWLTGDLVFQAENGLYYHVDRTVDRALVAQRMVYSCQLEELLMKRVPEIFDCTVVGTPAEPGRDAALAVAVELADADCDRAALDARIGAVLADEGITVPLRTEIVASGWNEGLTGKKLKRVIRDDFKSNQQQPAVAT
ncbi:MAG TPA: class I adenylate-forming enzyme family protein [Polyangiaceae bacterium]|nr:class I adenylate-forming enzyme family protein [Polyangiaceae bacterium]